MFGFDLGASKLGGTWARTSTSAHTYARTRRWIEQLKKCEPLKEHEVKQLCQRALEVLVEESNVQRVDSPVTICEFRETFISGEAPQ